MSKGLLTSMDDSKSIDPQQHELSEDMELVGPGLLLSEARKKLALTAEEVTEKLNFRRNLVDDIENDDFDQALPATFNRGYLRNYAKLVNVDVEEVLAAYDMLGVAQVQRSEMQSFSNLTEKEAEHSRLMWLSYLIAAIFFGLMVVWWLQSPTKNDAITELTVVNTTKVVTLKAKQIKNISPKESLISQESTLSKESILPNNMVQANTEKADTKQSIEPITNKAEPAILPKKTVIPPVLIPAALIPTEISTAVFTFSGDCWVKVYDATGERIAWGMKKSGYVMTILGKQPFKVTLGKPELASIKLNGHQVDMSSIDVNNIANFTLPIKAE